MVRGLAHIPALGVGIAVLLFNLFVVPPNAVNAVEGKTISGTPESVYVFHDGAKEKYLQIGDDRGSISDIKGFLTGISGATGKSQDEITRFVGNEHVFRFTLENKPKSTIIEVKIYSLVPKDHPKYDCLSALRVNDTEKFDLRDGENVGYGKMTIFSKEVSNLRMGENEIKIREYECIPSGTNDSLLVKGLVKF